MTDRPIIFNGDMVRAILDGRKTQTRRVVKMHKDGVWRFDDPPKLGWISSPHPLRNRFGVFITNKTDEMFPLATIIPCPHGAPGDRLWVRETWMPMKREDSRDPYLVYRAGGSDRDISITPKIEDSWTDIYWREHPANWVPSIYMPRWASRITLEITDVRVERLQDISRADCTAEGIVGLDGAWKKWETPYANLWNSINASKHPWSSNPWVWAITFRRIET